MKESQQIITRQEAIEKGLSRYFTGKACVNGHASERLTSSGQCTGCFKHYYKKMYQNPEYRQKAIARSHKNYDKEKAKQNARLWCKRNPEKRKQIVAAWEKRNKDYMNAKTARRYARKGKATLKSVTIKDIMPIYKQARLLTEKTGVQYHVDHIVPLFGEAVCGLHVPWNLRVITAKENQNKSNKLITQ